MDQLLTTKQAARLLSERCGRRITPNLLHALITNDRLTSAGFSACPTLHTDAPPWHTAPRSPGTTSPEWKGGS